QEALTQLGLTTRGFKEVLVSAADAGRLFLFIDGWDELPGVGLGHSGRWLEELLLAYPETRVLMSAPIRGYGPLHRLDFLVAGLIPWRRGQAMAVGQNWAAARDEGRSPSMMSYWRPGQTPLVTWLRLNQLARADSAGQPPIRLSASEMLRQEVDHALMSQMLESDATSMLPVLRRLIQHLAHQMIADRTWALAEEDVTILAETLPGTMPGDELRPGTTEVLRILSGSGLFADAANSVRFLSPVIRDYLAAMYLVGHVGWADVTRRVSESHWAGAIRFYMAFIGSRGRLAELPELDQHERQLYQAVSWVTDMKGEDPSRRRVLISLGKRCLDTKAPPIARQRAAVALAATGDPGVAVLMHQVMRQPDPAMRQVALAVLAQVAPRDVVEAAPRMMSDSDRRVRAASVHALAWIGDPAADEALLEALYSKDTSISGAAAEALALSGTDPNYQALRDAAQSRQFSARQAARTGLRLIDEPWAAELLVRSLSIDGLASASGSGSTPFVDRSDQDAARWRRLRAGDQPWLVAWAVERGQIVPVGQAAVPLLLEALLDGEAAIRVRAAATLGQLAILDGTGALREALHDVAPEVRQAAFIALSKIGRAWDMDA
ncbi:MAG: HEAT repeat domain-containing protein, partial [Candidatus Promineifilaceae bacterium]